MILLTGAAGKTGRAIVRGSAAQSKAVRATVHRESDIDLLRRIGATEVLVTEMTSPNDLARACAGISIVYHICPNMHPNELEIGRIAIEAARGAGVERFIYHSVLHPQTEEMSHHWQKLRVEELLFKSGLAFTVVQPAPYMQNVLSMWNDVVQEGEYRVPYAPSSALGMVDLRDVAAAVAQIMADESTIGGIFELCGGERLSQDEIAAELAEALGRTVRAVALDRAEWAQAAQQRGLDEYAVTTLLRMFDYYERYGLWGSPYVLGQLLGRPPTTFADFLRRQTMRKSI